MNRKQAEAKINLLRSPNGGFTKKSLDELGVQWPPYRGWRQDVIRRLSGKDVNPQKEIQQRARRSQKIKSKPDCKKPYRADTYAGRNATLRNMGYCSYSKYLASKLWLRIRLRVYKAKGRHCELCGNKANQVHHNSYSLTTLRGRQLRYLHPLCRGCHYEIEFTENGAKRPMSEVKRQFARKLAVTT
jgi:hypothetical protein